jgi:DNA-binding transcriptional ArsR family regulator
VGQGWFDAVETQLGADVLGALERLGMLPWGSLSGRVLTEGWPGDVSSCLERVASLVPEDLWLTLIGGHIPALVDRVGRPALERAAAGDAASRSAITQVLGDLLSPDLQDCFGLLCGLSAGEARDLVLTVLHGWHRDRFAAIEGDVASILMRDLAAKRRLHRGLSDEALIEAATNGLVYTQEPWVRRLILAPQTAMRPWNVMTVYDDAYVICYPIADESLGVDRSAPAARMLRLYKALGDDKRLRILKLLEAESLTLQQIADAIGLVKSSTHHHMVILRSAGLVKTTLEDDSRYTLRRETIPEPSALLADFLNGGA